MSLEVDDVAVPGFGLRSQEMVEGNFVEGRSGRERGDVSADAFLRSCWRERPWLAHSSGPDS